MGRHGSPRDVSTHMNYEIIATLRQIARERDLDVAELVAALEEALLEGYLRLKGANPEARIVVDTNSGDLILVTPHGEAEMPEELSSAQISQALGESDWSSDDLDTAPLPVDAFGRMAVRAVRRAVGKNITDIIEQRQYDDMIDRIGEAMVAVVRRVEPRGRRIWVDLGHGIEGQIPREEQVRFEQLREGAKVWASLVSVARSRQGLDVILSRKSPDLVRGLFEEECPEIQEGWVEITRVVRAPGVRSKIGVIRHEQDVDPVGALIGPRGARIRSVGRELAPREGIDVVDMGAPVEKMIARAMGPGRPTKVIVDEAGRKALVIVPDDKKGLAIGERGINARLAAALVGYGLEIRSASEHAAAARSGESGEGDMDANTCHYVSDAGRRCKNAPVDDTSWCGLHPDGVRAEVAA